MASNVQTVLLCCGLRSLPSRQAGARCLGGAPPLTPTPAPQEAEVSVYKQVRKKGEGG